ncbi:ABC transporter G family member 41 [Nymphaea thermarum]|nr:ABC transporter G family member 41 [Nymphaea thermarum]
MKNLGSPNYVSFTICQEMRNQGVTGEKASATWRHNRCIQASGVFRLGVLTALMGVCGAGKTTLMDVLSGRKTGGRIEGDMWIGGHPKVQETLLGYLGTVNKPIFILHMLLLKHLIYSAWLRLAPEIDDNTKREFINKVLETIELDRIKDALVGIPSVNGLPTEQRKHLTIAVELVANPSIIFLDEPTSDLDARAAAIVMRTVRNMVNTGRTVVCTIHQPTNAAKTWWSDYLCWGIVDVPKIKDNYNPTTWMLEVTTISIERQLNIVFAQLYMGVISLSEKQRSIKQLSTPSLGSKDLSFQTVFPQNDWGQFKVCLWKQYLLYQRNPSYNLSRIAFVLITSFLFAALYWKHGQKMCNLFTILGLLFSITIFLAINNCMTVHSVVAAEWIVMYRERFVGMYSAHAYSLAQSSYLGMLVVSLTPNAQIAAILQSVFNTLLALFSGFLISGKQIQKWWIWQYWITPSNWTIRGLFTSQYGDIDKEIDGFGEKKAVSLFLKDYFGFRHDQLGVVAVVLIALLCLLIVYLSLIFKEDDYCFPHDC